MPPSQRQPSSLSSCQVAGRSSFNIMWHYAKAAERGQRVTNIMSAPFRVWARCGLLPHRRAAGRRGSAAQHSAAHRLAALTSAVGSRAPSVAPTAWPPSLAAQATCQLSANVNPKAEAVPASRRLTASCPPGCVWLRGVAVAGSLLLPRSPASAPAPVWRGHAKPGSSLRHSVTERRRASLADSVPPAPAEPAPGPQTSSVPGAGCRGNPKPQKAND
ncbi:hypothetical protein [Pectobacterium sp. CFBP8739]|uniref:hypothetical protein n=1 Tax=Pectobacterium sp. CFBP8739 TaxID=2748908 RepID=UPI0015DEAE57|nr:hypothetical protein [Pectobacterium sp. CFBP8739]MBA0168493.1 hypothetical protein [Pectobacterium sp. CFBP8739]